MRTGATLTYLFGDQINSTSVAYRLSDNTSVTQLYKPWGETRYASASLPTPYTFTGQYNYLDDIATSGVSEGFGLMFYNARWFDPNIVMFTSPDTLIPDPYNALDWNRYMYVRGNPLKYRDSSGHMADDGDDGGCNSSRCKDIRRQDYLITLIYKGSGDDGSWTAEDLDYYIKNRDLVWKDASKWKNPDTETGWDLFALHVQRLASNYDLVQQRQFVEDFSLLFGGISQDKSWPAAAWEAMHGPKLPFINESNDGLAPRYLDSEHGPKDNQSHHYVGLFFLSYFIDPEAAMAVNYARDSTNGGDIALGNQAAVDAYFFHFYYSTPSSMVKILLALKNP